MAGFMDSFKELLWPEGMGWGIGVLTHWAARGIDYRLNKTKPFRRSQDYVALAAAGGSAYGHANTVGDTREVMRGIFASNGTLVIEAGADALYTPEQAFGKRKVRRKVRGNAVDRTQPQLEGDIEQPQQEEAYPRVHEEELIT